MEIMFDTSTDRGKVSGTELTDSANSSMVNTHGHKGGIFWLKAIVSTGDTVDVTIEGYDQIQGAWTALSAAVGGDRAYAFAQCTAGTTSDQLTVYPGLTGVNNQTINGVLPEIIRAVATVGGSSEDIDLTLGVDLLK
jgi:hypothetical protein